jgi:predicted GH43/DUF377 family glycosyl hydrolase
MKWKKMGLIYSPKEDLAWGVQGALTPTPVLMGDFIRVFSGFRDREGVSRIGYVDLDADNPARILAVSSNPVLDIGKAGAFDDHGVILGDVVQVGDLWRMYYVGFQLVPGVKFLAFTGLAISDRKCATFSRWSEAPVLDRSDEGLYIRAIHTVLYEDNVWKAWYAAGRSWQLLDGWPYPSYEIRYAESSDGIHFSSEGVLCLAPQGEEYRIGRPRVFREGDSYGMFFTKGDHAGSYLSCYASSNDGQSWHRDDAAIGICPSREGWDSRALCYATPLDVGEKRYLFYNGNDMGRDGFGYAERKVT